jgi:hypothetical protein
MSVYPENNIFALNEDTKPDDKPVSTNNLIGEKLCITNDKGVCQYTHTRNGGKVHNDKKAFEKVENKHSSLSECELIRAKSEVSKLLKSYKPKPLPSFVGSVSLPVSTKGNKDIKDNLTVQLMKSSVKKTLNLDIRCDTDIRCEIDKDKEDKEDKTIKVADVKSKVLRLFLINFEDDTFKPVIGIGHKQINIINSWYEKCGQTIDIEETEIDIPKNVGKTFKHIIQGANDPIECKHRDTFIQNYIPEIINALTAQAKLQSLSKNMNITSYANIEINSENKHNETESHYHYSKLNIVVPESLIYLEPYFYTDASNKKITLDKYQRKKEENENVIEKLHKSPYGCTFPNPDYEKENKNFIEKLHKSPYGCTFSNPYDKAENKDTEKNKDTEVKCYNEDYDALKPCFGTNCLKITDDTTKADVKPNYLIMVLFNPLFFQTLVLVSPDCLTIETIFECVDYGFVELFTISTNDAELETLVKKQYDGVIFNNAEEVNNTLLSTSNFVEYIKTKKPSQISDEEILVKEYFTKFYNITTDINQKMKASTLYDNIIKHQVCKFNDDTRKQSGFKNRLSTYLKNMGLQKKRYNDGYYYYGIAPIDNYVYNIASVENVEVISRKRRNEIGELYKGNVNELFRFKAPVNV